MEKYNMSSNLQQSKMSILSAEKIKSFESSCKELSKIDGIRHVGVINRLGHLVAGDTKKGVNLLLDREKIGMVYMQLQLDFQMRKELDEILGPIDYIASRRKNLLVISVPVKNYLIIITAEPDTDDKKIIKKAEKIFEDISF
jgi:hypothetical protein